MSENKLKDFMQRIMILTVIGAIANLVIPPLIFNISFNLWILVPWLCGGTTLFACYSVGVRK